MTGLMLWAVHVAALTRRRSNADGVGKLPAVGKLAVEHLADQYDGAVGPNDKLPLYLSFFQCVNNAG
jgi:hypothetical protein